ncbi:ABC transporter ATP-binding protein [Aneurinibacillus uraniidurans]|uniref:ABC transporter ATP-binding protein n=1 Tax=Aneurinibacillus uraniidurans TaxID=2966586 RepID=UPI00234B8152|nr:ABC transporter ATP-binding protein [Aneurinibacillus sp. B1]WCN38092.1 ABC transporter ATP-binding protein [Aneurinibacillus sp. B1]
MSTDNVAIRVENLTKVYKLYDKPVDRLKESLHPLRKTYHQDFYALNKVSFEIKKGETVGIIGKNGSGKSTLLKIITGVLQPTLGTARVNGKISALLELGAGFNPEMTGIENIYLNGTIMGYTKEEMDEKLYDILAFADIGDFVYQLVKTYSSGMFARLAFAVAINVDPEILIVDEALSVGDVFFQQKCFNRLKELKEEGKTILFVSHDVVSVSTLCDKCLLISEGRLLSEGQPRKVINEYIRIISSDESKRTTNSNIALMENEAKSEDVGIEEYRYGSGGAIIKGIKFFGSNDSESLVYTLDYFSIEVDVEFRESFMNPVIGFYIKNKRGVELYSGNTYYLNHNIGLVQEGEKVKVIFKQKMVLSPDEYILSFGLSDYINGISTPLDRRYDYMKITVKSDRTIIGIVDMDAEVNVVKGK